MTSPPPVVFVHGLIGSLQVPDLLSYFPAGRALAPDLLGYGAHRDAAPGEISVDAQVKHLRRVVRGRFAGEPIHIVGHSVGGAIAMQFAYAYPELVRSVVSVEGNFTLEDAFWTSSVARMGAAEVDRLIAGFRDDPAGWLAGSGIDADDAGLAVASQWLAHQPATTVKAMAESVVEVTGASEYLLGVRSVFDRHMVHLVAGERSADGWDVPDWAKERAASFTVISGTGHLMMLERTAEFATLVRDLVADPESA